VFVCGVFECVSCVVLSLLKCTELCCVFVCVSV